MEPCDRNATRHVSSAFGSAERSLSPRVRRAIETAGVALIDAGTIWMNIRPLSGARRQIHQQSPRVIAVDPIRQSEDQEPLLIEFN
jgi:hypothetical protein